MWNWPNYHLHYKFNWLKIYYTHVRTHIRTIKHSKAVIQVEDNPKIETINICNELKSSNEKRKNKKRPSNMKTIDIIARVSTLPFVIINVEENAKQRTAHTKARRLKEHTQSHYNQNIRAAFHLLYGIWVCVQEEISKWTRSLCSRTKTQANTHTQPQWTIVQTNLFGCFVIFSHCSSSSSSWHIVC